MVDIDNIPVRLVDGDLSTEFNGAITETIFGTRVGVDIETSGLDYIHDKIATIQVYLPSMGVEIVRIREGQTPPYNIISLLEDSLALKIFHYGTFDLSFLVRNWNVKARGIADTRIAATIIDPFKSKYYNPTREKNDHGLAALVWTYYKDRLDKELAISDWFGNLTPAQLSYASKDVIYLPPLLDKLYAEMDSEQLEEYHTACIWLPSKVRRKVNNLPDPFERY